MGKRLDLLFNSNCYGARAVSEHLQNEVGSVLDYLEMRGLLPEAVTTTSLTVARTLKKYFPDIDVRASVNMRIESPESMSYVSGLFDSFYVRRDNQRNIQYVASVKKWCDQNGKGLYMLANSGCLYRCPGQTFHDNMVAHDAEIDETKNIRGWTPHVCWNLFADESKRAAVLRESWIRPEDIRHYEGLVPMMKLATRMHERPRTVISAYVSGRYDGNLLDLFEPGHGRLFAPHIIHNTRFPEDWHETVSACARNCHECGYCDEVFSRVYIRSE
jgi:collagenase-like PrtC family protease